MKNNYNIIVAKWNSAHRVDKFYCIPEKSVKSIAGIFPKPPVRTIVTHGIRKCVRIVLAIRIDVILNDELSMGDELIIHFESLEMGGEVRLVVRRWIDFY